MTTPPWSENLGKDEVVTAHSLVEAILQKKASMNERELDSPKSGAMMCPALCNDSFLCLLHRDLTPSTGLLTMCGPACSAYGLSCQLLQAFFVRLGSQQLCISIYED